MGVSVQESEPPGRGLGLPDPAAGDAHTKALPDSPSASVNAVRNGKALSPDIAPVLASSFPPSFLASSSTSASATPTTPSRASQRPRSSRCRQSASHVSDAPFSDPVYLPYANQSSSPGMTPVNAANGRSRSGRSTPGGYYYLSAAATSARVPPSKSTRPTVFKVESVNGTGQLYTSSKSLVFRVHSSGSATSEGPISRRHMSKKHWSMASDSGVMRQGPDAYFSAAPFSEAPPSSKPATPARKSTPRPTVFCVQPDSSAHPVHRSLSAASTRSPWMSKPSPGRTPVTSPGMPRPHSSHGPRKPGTPSSLKRPSTSQGYKPEAQGKAAQGKVSFNPDVIVRIKSCRSWDASDSEAEGSRSRELLVQPQPIAMSKSDDTTPGHSGPLGPGGLSTCLEEVDMADLVALLEEDEEEDDLFGMGEDKTADVSAGIAAAASSTVVSAEVETKVTPLEAAVSESFADCRSELDPATPKAWGSPGPSSHVKDSNCVNTSEEQEAAPQETGDTEEVKDSTTEAGKGSSQEGDESEKNQSSLGGVQAVDASTGNMTAGQVPTSGGLNQRPGTGQRVALAWHTVTSMLRRGRGREAGEVSTRSVVPGPKPLQQSASGGQANITCMGC